LIGLRVFKRDATPFRALVVLAVFVVPVVFVVLLGAHLRFGVRCYT
jgi:hypothetical protein